MTDKIKCYKVSVANTGELVKEHAKQLPMYVDMDSTAAIRLWRHQAKTVYVAISDMESLEQQWAILKGAR